MRRLLPLLAAFFCLAAFPAAHAETDYRCVSLCADNGAPGPVCLKQCRYDVKPALPENAKTRAAKAAKATATQLSEHNVFAPPEPVMGNKLVLQQKPKPPKPPVDYACASGCLADHMQDDLCREQCAEVRGNRNLAQTETPAQIEMHKEAETAPQPVLQRMRHRSQVSPQTAWEDLQ
ncbi:MAG: hypothetical protein KGI97_01100 [Alphaproteobacteria bacterium]|nr:hypothetical protein [Alphaproteobacteria bacterium]